jgi:hypothetical protein
MRASHRTSATEPCTPYTARSWIRLVRTCARSETSTRSSPPGSRSGRDPLPAGARGKRPYRTVPYICAAPNRRGAIGQLAWEVFHDRYGGLKGLRSPDFPLLNRLLGGDSTAHGELLSYLLFDPEFIDILIDLGRGDASRWLATGHGPTQLWQVEALEPLLEDRPG